MVFYKKLRDSLRLTKQINICIWMNCAIIQRKISLFYNWWKAKKILSKHSFKNNDIVKNEFFHFTLVNLFYLLDIFIMLIWIALTFLKYILLYQVAVNQFQRKENCKGSTFFVTMIQFSSFEARSQILLQLSCYNKIRSVAQCLLKGSKPTLKKVVWGKLWPGLCS